MGLSVEARAKIFGNLFGSSLGAGLLHFMRLQDFESVDTVTPTIHEHGQTMQYKNESLEAGYHDPAPLGTHAVFKNTRTRYWQHHADACSPPDPCKFHDYCSQRCLMLHVLTLLRSMALELHV